RARERAPHARGHAGRVARELPRQAGLPRALRRRPRKGGARLTRTRRARYVLGPPNMEKTVNRISALARHESAAPVVADDGRGDERAPPRPGGSARRTQGRP